MVINANTKIASILKENSEALEAIISVSDRFQKLRNPLLRKIMAPRTSIAMAAKIGGCSIQNFFQKLQPLGFEIDNSIPGELDPQTTFPPFLENIPTDKLTSLDVRSMLASGDDPLRLINQHIKALPPGNVLKIINSFYPQPLVSLLQKQGFEAWANIVSQQYVETFFARKAEINMLIGPEPKEEDQSFDEVLLQFNNNILTIDVRELEMPLPMLSILKELKELPAETALVVLHKRIPLFLLPELSTREYSYRIKHISEGNVNLIIFKR